MSETVKNTPFTRAELDGRQEADVRSELVMPDKIYLDLRLLKDYTLGALISMVMKEEDQSVAEAKYNAIKTHLVDYDHRITDDVAQFFPSCGLSTDEIEAYIKDPTNTHDIITYSPGTQFIVAMQSNLQTNINHSHASGSFTKVRVPGSTDRYYKKWNDVTYIVNTYPLPKPQGDDLLKLQLFFVRTFSVNVIVISRDPKTLPGAFYLNVDEFDVYQIGQHFENPALVKLTIDARLIGKMFFSSMIFQREKLVPILMEEKNFRCALDTISAQNNVTYRTFDWINPAFLSADVSPYAVFGEDHDEEIKRMIREEILNHGRNR